MDIIHLGHGCQDAVVDQRILAVMKYAGGFESQVCVDIVWGPCDRCAGIVLGLGLHGMGNIYEKWKGLQCESMGIERGLYREL